MVNSINGMSLPLKTQPRPDTTGVLASRTNINIFASAKDSPPVSIFGSGAAETSGAMASSGSSGSSGDGGNTVAVA